MTTINTDINTDIYECECKDAKCTEQIKECFVKASYIPRKKDVYRYGFTEQNNIDFYMNLCTYHHNMVNVANENYMIMYGKYPGGWDYYDILDEIVYNYYQVYNINK